MPFLPTFNDDQDQFDWEPGTSPASRVDATGPDQRVRVVLRALKQMKVQVETLVEFLESGQSDIPSSVFKTDVSATEDADGRVLEGVFDGEKMIGTDGMKYNVPPNYASKSKLVEGDVMKLVIKDDGSFIYKQIGPVERERVVGTLGTDDYGNFALMAPDGTSYRVLMASVTYYKGEPGDEAVGLLPKGQKARWAAVENIMKR